MNKFFNIALLALVASSISPIALSGAYEFHQRVPGLKYNSYPQVLLMSCKDIFDAGLSTGNGVYELSSGATVPRVYCDMTSHGGGWTLIAAQFENSTVQNWNQGVGESYNPDPSSKIGFSLSQSQIPSHTQTSFGKDEVATFVEYFNYQYTTGNIANTQIQGIKNGIPYRIHRNSDYYYNWHDPDNSSGIGTISSWINTLTINRVGFLGEDWAFSPMNSSSVNRGYAMNGSRLQGSAESYGWTVWVR